MPLAFRSRPTSTMTTLKKLAALPLALACLGTLCFAVFVLAAATPSSVRAASADTPQPALGTYVAATTPPTALEGVAERRREVRYGLPVGRLVELHHAVDVAVPAVARERLFNGLGHPDASEQLQPELEPRRRRG